MKSWLSVTALKFFALFPLGLLRSLGGWLGFVVWLSNNRSRKITEFNLQLCYPELSSHERRQLAQNSMRHLGKLVLEMGPVWLWPAEKILQHIKQVTGIEVLEQAEALGQGTIIALPHLGSWELMGLFLGARGNLTALYQPPEDPRLDVMIFKARRRTGNNLVATNVRGVKALLKALKAGESIVILPDQTPAVGSGEFSRFYNEQTYTMTLVHNLVKRTGARVVTAIAQRSGKSDFDIHFQAAPEAIYANNSEQSLTALNQAVKCCVEQSPEQYQWEYNRFKLLPNGSKRSYRQIDNQ